MRKLKIDMIDLELAFSASEMSGMCYYLDLETGKVMMTTEDDRSAVDEFIEEIEKEESDEDINVRFEKWLDEYGCPDWQLESIREAFLIEQGLAGRFIDVPKQDSREGYNDMVEFAETVTDRHLKELLFTALNGRGAFRRFKDVLFGYPDERQRFFEFSDRMEKDRIFEWLADEGIELDS